MKAPIALALGAVAGGTASPGDLRIKGGDIANRMFHGSVFGRLEIFGGDAMTWGTVCDQGFSMEDATVACQQLGYRQAGWFSNYYKIRNRFYHIFVGFPAFDCQKSEIFRRFKIFLSKNSTF